MAGRTKLDQQYTFTIDTTKGAFARRIAIFHVSMPGPERTVDTEHAPLSEYIGNFVLYLRQRAFEASFHGRCQSARLQVGFRV
jgi:hypothetical protein